MLKQGCRKGKVEIVRDIKRDIESIFIIIKVLRDRDSKRFIQAKERAGRDRKR